MTLVFIVCIVLAILGLTVSKNNIFSPSVITPVVWIVVLLLFVALPHDLPPLSWQFFGSLLLWVAMMCLGAMFTQSFRYRVSVSEPSQLIRDIFFWVSVATFPLLLLFVKEALQTGETGNWALDLRLAAIGKTSTFKEVYGGLYLIVWQVAYLIELFYYSKKNRHRVIILGLMFLALGIGTMSKTILLEFILKTVGILFFKNKIKMKHFVVALVVLLVAFVVMQSMRYNSSVGALDRKSFLITYVVGNTSAFDTLEPNSSTHCGENVFRMYYAISNKLGLSDVKPVDPILPFIYKPLETNTYTAMYPFFKDFGYWGVGVFALLYGLLFGWIFRCAQEGSPMFIILNAIIIPIVVMQYVGDVFITNLSGYIKQIILLALPFVFSYRRKLSSPPSQ